MSLESAGGRLVPDRAQRKWMIAQAHIVERDGQLDEVARSAAMEGRTDYVKPAVEFLGAKEAYDETISAIKNTVPTANNMFDNFISEKSLNIHNVSLRIC